MPRFPALTLSALGLVLTGACHSAPAEQISVRDGGLTATAAHSRADAGASAGPDAGRSPMEGFCDDVYAADSARLALRCQAQDLNLAKGLSRAASRLCVDDVTAAVARSRTSFDPDAARHCIEMLATVDSPRASDTDTLFQHYPCDRVLLGNQAEGQPCRFSVECKDGLACQGFATGVDGTCKPPSKAAAACESQRFGSILNEEAAAVHHPSCAAGTWCDSKVCKPRVASGGTCATSSNCANGLACVMGKCGSVAAEGAACFQSADCTYGLWCNRPAASGTGRCEAKRRGGAECPVVDACRGRCDMPRDGGKPTGPGRCADVCGSG